MDTSKSISDVDLTDVEKLLSSPDMNMDGKITPQELKKYNEKRAKALAKERKTYLRYTAAERRFRIKSLRQQMSAAKEISTAKFIVFCVMMTFFVGVMVGSFVVLFKEPTQLGTLLTFIGTLTGSAFCGYMIKSGFENVAHIKKGNIDPKDTMQASIISTTLEDVVENIGTSFTDKI